MTREDTIGAIEEAEPDRIVIDQLVVQAAIGLLEHEHGRTQALRFDIEMTTVPGYRQIVREHGTIVSYAEAVDYIRDRAATGEHVDLVEEWAEAVAGFVLQNELVASVRVKVTKPDIFAEAGGVGITVIRRRPR